MNYELARQLKDAGWPQNPDNPQLHTPGCNGWGTQPEGLVCTSGSRPRVPTLEELIEECSHYGEPVELVVNPDGHSSARLNRGPEHYTGNTPDESVARLWLALNKK